MDLGFMLFNPYSRIDDVHKNMAAFEELHLGYKINRLFSRSAFPVFIAFMALVFSWLNRSKLRKFRLFFKVSQVYGGFF